MERVKHFIFLFLFVLSSFQAVAQIKPFKVISEKKHCDTIYCGDHLLVICVPLSFYINKSVFQYEEGFFVTYPYRDSAYLFIHKGHNATRPFCDTTIIKCLSENENQICYYGKYNDNFTKEIYYKKMGVTISYENIKEDDIPLFESIISSFNIFSIPVQNNAPTCR